MLLGYLNIVFYRVPAARGLCRVSGGTASAVGGTIGELCGGVKVLGCIPRDSRRLESSQHTGPPEEEVLVCSLP